MGMALDFRLNALRLAILEDWLELEAYEVEGALVIRVGGREKTSETQEERQPKPCRRAWHHAQE
jgi:hypothetical protein